MANFATTKRSLFSINAQKSAREVMLGNDIEDVCQEFGSVAHRMLYVQCSITELTFSLYSIR